MIHPHQVHEYSSIIDHSHHILGEGSRLLGCLCAVHSLSIRVHRDLDSLRGADRYVLLSLGMIYEYTDSVLPVKVEPQGNNLPLAIKVGLCAARSGWKLDHSKQSYQTVQHGVTVPWSDKFVDELKRGLIACRVMYAWSSLPQG